MVRNFKVLGLAAMATLAMAAVAVAGASAAEFHVAEVPAIIHGEQVGTHKFTTTQGNVTCAAATFEKTVTTKTTLTQDVHPTYSNCHLTNAEFISATVTTTGCDYHFHNVVESGGELTGPTDIVCEAGKSISVVTVGCTIKVPGQTGLSSIKYVNTESGGIKDVDVTANVSGISYTTSGGICGTHSESNGTYTGLTTIRAYKDESGKRGTEIYDSRVE